MGGFVGYQADLLASGHKRTLEFFVTGLRDVSEPEVDGQELLYNASVLAHFAQVSTQADDEMPTPADLTVVFDHYVIARTPWQGSQMLETAGAQCLLLAGFFERQMGRRHSIRWYSELGIAFFSRAASQTEAPARSQLFTSMSQSFELWRRRYYRLSQELRDQPYLIRPQ